jgi:hypothetical protein
MSLFAGNGWDVALLAIAGYFAVIALVQLMLGERHRLAKELDAQIAAEQARLAAEKRKAEKERRRQEMAEEFQRQKRKAA